MRERERECVCVFGGERAACVSDVQLVPSLHTHARVGFYTTTPNP